MRAVLMAGGSGTRLRPLTCDLPKPMVPVLNRPIAEHIVNLLKRHDIKEVIATLHYLPDVMRDYFQDGHDFGVQMTYAVEEDQPLGTAGCVKNIAELLDDTFLVISGDSITDFDLKEAVRFHKEKGSKATLVLTRVPNPIEFGVVITDEEGRIKRFLEKPSTSEIFSDTVNTGTYILEPEVLEYLPPNQEKDFSKDLFPLLLEKGDPMYGYVAEGYWCDVGHLEAYREAQYDALESKVLVDFAYPEVSPGVHVGQNTHIDPTAVIKPPVLIGRNCRIGARVILEPGTVIGDNVTVGSDADLKRPIIWNGAIIGDETHLRACVIARGTRADRRAHVLEGAVVGALSTVGEEAQISPGVRVWPSKRIESGATLNINLIWGNTAQRNLFGQRGVTGLANIDITPEFAVKLGAAYGSTLKPGSNVTVSRDQRSISRMVSRSLIAGLMSVGINVQNLEATAIPLARAILPTLDVAGGIHVRIHPDRADQILIEFFDKKGIDIPKGKEKKIEGAYFKENLRRSQIHEIGEVAYPANLVDIYTTEFEKRLNVEAIRHSKSKVVIDYAYAVSGAVLPRLLGKFSCDAVVLNASLSQTAPSNTERESMLGQLGQVVQALQATFGVQVAANGEQLVLMDEVGSPIRGEMLTALMTHMILTAQPKGTVVVDRKSVLCYVIRSG
ncbi:MAG: NTP transferase domain-containing protein, partial [Leptolyngbya sp. SIO3F4]|nr:NTP transferase domain-containing protein [Leptolyngbya sp. SIO3F4]